MNWRFVFEREKFPRCFLRIPTKVSQPTPEKQILLELFQFLIQMRKRCFESFLVIRVCGCFQVVENVFAREFDIRTFAIFFQLVLGFLSFAWCCHVLPARYLGLNIF